VSDAAGRLTVVFDDGCAVCRAMVSTAKRQRTTSRIEFVGASVADSRPELEVLAADAAERAVQVRMPHGELMEGAEAVGAVLMAMPTWRWVGRIAGYPGVRPLARVLYALFARVRHPLSRILERTNQARTG